MEIKTKKHLEDIRKALELLRTFIDGFIFEQYQQNDLLRSGVERQFEIIGEALNRLHKTDAKIAAQITDSGRIIAFRNILIHGYDIVDDAIVWDVVENKLATLQNEVTALLST